MPKVEIAYINPTSRMRYGAKLLFDYCLGVDHAWVEGANDEYVEITHGDKSISSPIHAISFSQDEQALNSGVKFPCEVLGVCDLDYDPFAAAIFLAAQWEDVFKGDQIKKDKHNRFIGRECSKPEVELLAVSLAGMLGIAVDTSRYSYQPTIDVDIAYAFKGRTKMQTILASIKDLLMLRWKNLAHRISVLSGSSDDPYDTYEWIDVLHKQNGLNTKAFFLCANHSRPYDIGLPREEVVGIMQTMTKWDLNWHPSYRAMTSLHQGDLDAFSEEKKLFPGLTSEVRAHFLRCDVRHWSKLVEMEVKDDFSLGYADVAGFRSGICRPYPAFDLINDRELPLTIHPVVVMDSTLSSYMGLSPKEGVELVVELNNEVRSVGGLMTTLFHNTSVSNFGEWKGWRVAYEEIVDLCSKPNN